jgi:hypothetical protein
VFTADEAIESRMEYLAGLPPRARDAWVEAAHEVWLMGRLKERDQDTEDEQVYFAK